MESTEMIDKNVADLMAHYETGTSGSTPSAEQWRHLATLPTDKPVTLVNFFKLREKADYEADDEQAPCSGQEAFDRYAAVSVPTLSRVGGKFLLLAPFSKTLIGAEEDWDLVVVGTYPSTSELFALFEDESYCQAFKHRIAACAAQKVILCEG